MNDEAWLAEPPKRSRLRLALMVALAASLVFLGGVEVQKHFGLAGDQAAGGQIAGGQAAGARAARGGLQGGSGLTPEQGVDAGQAPAGGSDAAAASTAVIGTLESVDGTTWTVKDLGGNVHTITVGESVRIVQESALGADEVKNGSTVNVSGTTDDEGEMQAATITIR